jgi:cytochrome P450
MVLHPEVQQKAQEEIDRTVGGNRLPSFADRTSLPYISWIVWECLRWNPVAPMGLPHFSTEEDEYKGYRIPKGSTVWANTWYGTRTSYLFSWCRIDAADRAILHDEHTYPEPLRFNPERFENLERNKLAGINEEPTAAFGFGRRWVVDLGPTEQLT